MPSLPSSLSPHICVLSSPDLAQVLKSASLPGLPQILQSFAPLPQVSTRTTAFTTVTHPSFALRFSDLSDVETALKEDEERRAARTLDWISARISHRAAKWVDDLEKLGEQGHGRSPWWDELRKCIQGETTPIPSETWNHPVAVIFAVSTAAPNPLHAITALQSQQLQFPSWVDPHYLRCNLIVHPSNSPLSDEEVAALFNAVKKQFGLESFLLPLDLPSPSPPPIAVPPPMPKLPPPPSDDTEENPLISMTPLTPTFPLGTNGNVPSNQAPPHSLRMIEKDIEQTAKFTREFVVMSLIPWMERCVTEWNENFNSTRRLPSRLFSSTRRLFGTPSSSPPPVSTSSTAGYLSRSSTLPPGANPSSVNGSPQQRRLAEFSTILGDYKLAIAVWESLRKEAKGGSDILPLLLSPSPTVPLHVSTALGSLQHPGVELSPSAQLRALVYAIRWESGIAKEDFLSSVYDGDRWLIWAAGNSEEPPSAILLALVAHLSFVKGAHRQATFWYASAASRLEKSGIKPLTKYFLRRARALATIRPKKSLSPSFWDGEGVPPTFWKGFEDILPGIEHPLGRLLYNTGDFAGAVQMLLGLLPTRSHALQLGLNDTNNSSDIILPGTDKAFVQDLQVAFGHYKSIAGLDNILPGLKLPISFCQSRKTKIRLPRETSLGDPTIWDLREEQWTQFWRGQGYQQPLTKSGKAIVNETFWADISLQNPLDTDISLTNLTMVSESSSDDLDLGVVETVNLGAKEFLTIPFSIKCSRPSSFILSRLHYDFLGLLPWSESLASRGRRLDSTHAHKVTPAYSPHTTIKVDVVETHDQLIANFIEDHKMILAQGERKCLRLWLSNMGSKPIRETWVVCGQEDILWIGKDEPNSAPLREARDMSNAIPSHQPHPISFSSLGKPDGLLPGDSVEVPVQLYLSTLGEHELHLLLVHRDGDTDPLHATRVTLLCEVVPSLEVTVTVANSPSPDASYALKLNIENISPNTVLNISQISVLSPTWIPQKGHDSLMGTIQPSQAFHTNLNVSPWEGRKGGNKTFQFVQSQLQCLLEHKGIEEIDPPPIHLVYEDYNQCDSHIPLSSPSVGHFIRHNCGLVLRRQLLEEHSHIPPHLLRSIFPLYHPLSLDLVIFWTIPEQGRSGHILASRLLVGVGHGELRSIVDSAENAKVKRSMYAETVREKQKVLAAVKNSEWNLETNPIYVIVQEPNPVTHDFSSPFSPLPIPFIVRNQSLTQSAKYVLKLQPGSEVDPGSSNVLPAPYVGRVVFRGLLPPCGMDTIHPKIWVSRPGTYSLSGWTLQAEVLMDNQQHANQEYMLVGSFEDRVTIMDVVGSVGVIQRA